MFPASTPSISPETAIRDLKHVLTTVQKGDGKSQIDLWLCSHFILFDEDMGISCPISISDVQRGNVEELLSEVFLIQPLSAVLADETLHHALVSMLFQLEAQRGFRFSSGFNPDISPSSPMSTRTALGLLPPAISSHEGYKGSILFDLVPPSPRPVSVVESVHMALRTLSRELQENRRVDHGWTGLGAMNAERMARMGRSRSRTEGPGPGPLLRREWSASMSRAVSVVS